ncbi:hypothetical protein [Segetibacter koreensis]|uniref:hypothetical protein n=1 Tax=Segetibacter koreensis TaxID=398037 RepID=UPI00146DD9F9|nr:hypothetical protein [Segetibacter koreensis]
MGYRVMICYEQQQSDKQLEASLNEDLYNEADLLTIKVPLSLPYLPNNSSFERVDGEIKINGKIYKYVKRRILEGQLVLLCLPDYNKMRLQSEANDSYKNISDATANSNSKKSSDSKSVSLKNIFSEFDKSELNYTSRIFSVQSCYSSFSKPWELATFPHATPEQPPEKLKALL